MAVWQKYRVRYELSWLYTTFDLPRSLKSSGTGKFLAQVVGILCEDGAKFATTEDLIKACKVEEAQLFAFSPVFTCATGSVGPQLHLKKVFKTVCTEAIKEDTTLALSKICECAKVVAKNKRTHHLYQSLLLRILKVLYDRLQEERRLWVREAIQEACRSLEEVGSKVVRIVVLGDGYDRTLIPGKGKGVLIHPSREALAPFELVRHNDDVFLLTANLTRLWEYLPGGSTFLNEVGDRVAELYGSFFTSITAQKNTRDCKLVLEAKKKLANYIAARKAKLTSVNAKLVIDIVFAGFGFRRNGEGPFVVLNEFHSMYRSVAFFNMELINKTQKHQCAYYLGMEFSALEAITRPQHVGMDFRSYIALSLRWPKPELPLEEECRVIRLDRVRRSLGVDQIDETPGSTILQAATLLEMERGNNNSRRQSQRNRNKSKLS